MPAVVPCTLPRRCQGQVLEEGLNVAQNPGRAICSNRNLGNILLDRYFKSSECA